MTGRRSVTHPSSVSALRADPPSPTRGEGKSAPLLTVASLSHIAPTRHREPPATDISGRPQSDGMFKNARQQAVGWRGSLPPRSSFSALEIQQPAAAKGGARPGRQMHEQISDNRSRAGRLRGDGRGGRRTRACPL
ncbi:hypothetical protein FJ976_02195 [Mesorhizobium sp. B1-1-9]|nr:hypothetical protein FJ978_03860 [Mesorhizobium sp. B1-1-7]TPN58746.1 hypothetical protein FJ976_02195 [Mesorhizobium sp. B1-1-9]